MSEGLREEDFKPINIGIFIAEKDGYEFIFQRQFYLDKVRAAQSSCILFIDREKQKVIDFNDALQKSNEFLIGPNQQSVPGPTE